MIDRDKLEEELTEVLLKKGVTVTLLHRVPGISHVVFYGDDTYLVAKEGLMTRVKEKMSYEDYVKKYERQVGTDKDVR